MTSTSEFGSSKRESHDSTPFYKRFPKPKISRSEKVAPPDSFPSPTMVLGDSRSMGAVADSSVGLVVTSPPYFAGKEYELLPDDGEKSDSPASYGEYLEMLDEVFSECFRTLEPGGRIAVNVANLGRKPYISLSGDVSRILSERGLMLRGEIIWSKGKGANGSVAWGSFAQPSNPVIRDTTERVIVASKGNFGRAIERTRRKKLGLPHRATISKEEFMEATLDVWHIPPEHATRIGHPAPFPVALPERLIQLYTYEDDLVLDPFAGSGTTLVAAKNTNRRGVGYEVNQGYVDLANNRLAEE